MNGHTLITIYSEADEHQIKAAFDAALTKCIFEQPVTVAILDSFETVEQSRSFSGIINTSATLLRQHFKEVDILWVKLVVPPQPLLETTSKTISYDTFRKQLHQSNNLLQF
ncbi:hypothetical protein [Teredinibacter haidensis]|uniref:hypothetical protein n=1 Tax=Teredinibacter haidensis TaxID=2731755 RepID=UPI0009491123|nr:hypothetical protein [Teredinibacter haidensis]